MQLQRWEGREDLGWGNGDWGRACAAAEVGWKALKAEGRYHLVKEVVRFM